MEVNNVIVHESLCYPVVWFFQHKRKSANTNCRYLPPHVSFTLLLTYGPIPIHPSYLSNLPLGLKGISHKHQDFFPQIPFNFAAMETRVWKFFKNKINGLLHIFRGRLLQDHPTDIETGASKPRRSPAMNEIPKNITGLGCDKEDNTGDFASAVTNIGCESPQQGGIQFTEGPARFVVANDGSKDCVALLITETLLTKLQELFEDNRHLSGKSAPLLHAQRDTRKIEMSVEAAKGSLDVAENQKLIRARERKEKLKHDHHLLERNVALSRSYTQWVLEKAMEEADLLGTRRPLTPIIPDYEETDGQYENRDEDKPKPPCVTSKQFSEIASESEVLRWAAHDKFKESLYLLNSIQAEFDDQKRLYEEDLIDYEQGFREGRYRFSQSEFDRRKVKYAMDLTGDLIAAETAFEKAKDRAQALDAIGLGDQQSSCYSDYQESWKEEQLASYNVSRDWSRIYDWMANVPDADGLENHNSQIEPETVELDDCEVGEVDWTDSVSVIDFDNYPKEIARWQDSCAQLDYPFPDNFFLGRMEEIPLERRWSF